MTDEDYRAAINNRLSKLEGVVAEQSKELAAMRTELAVSQTEQRNIVKTLDGILASLSRLNWLILASLVAGVMGWIVSGGLSGIVAGTP